MKKIICGRIYDTGRATLLATWDDPQTSNGHKYAEDLFRKKTGEFFKVVWESEARKGAVLPLTYDEAADWAKVKAPHEVYNQNFGEVSKGGAKRMLNLHVSGAAAELGRREATRRGVSISSLVDEFLTGLGD